MGKKVEHYLCDRDIYHQVSRNELKANYAERVIRTLKKKIYKYLYHNKTLKYIDALPNLVAGYNSSFHSSIKQAPNTVTYENESEVWAEQYIYRLWLEDGQTYKCMVVPLVLRDPLLILGHNHNGHNGSRRTYNALKRSY